VVDADASRIALTADGGEATRPGVWGVAWPGGYGLLSGPVRSTGGVVTRDFAVVDGRLPFPGTTVDLDTRAFPDDPSAVLGESPQSVIVDGPLGPYETLLFPGGDGTWVLLGHGNGLDRLDLGKLLPALRAAGHPVLLVPMRNDPGQPLDPSGTLRYGDTEWADFDAAVELAVGAGATGVVPVAPSMGAGVVLTVIERSAHAADIEAVVLDSPLIDFGRAVDAQAADERLPVVRLPIPGTLTATAKWIAGLRFGVDWDATGHLDEAEHLDVPVLIFHGTADDDVPIATSRELARSRPDIVALVEVEGATHLASWNVDPAAYEETLIGFLERVDGSPNGES
jgi:pimeloyl-ACP methyl ester carboxylesterase